MRSIVALSLLGMLTHAARLTAQVPPDKALATMKAGDGLQVELFAAEPMVINPTNMDIDPLGRVWITEAVNYRTKMRKKPLNREEGDRIVILTDKDGDGKADESTVFYQGKELYGPLGICVIPFSRDAKALRSGASDKPPVANAQGSLGFRVLVSQSPDILEFTDADGDGKADGPPKVFLTGFGGFDHDHGVHCIQVGPDGKFYFTVGDQGVKNLQSTDGKGKKYTSNGTDCRAGTVWRCDSDGKNLELIAHNFRNPYEACVDSFGEIWLSDNDDDGNQQTRICYVMPGGNYGYHPRGKGESHWHEEQPGIVHKTLRTGFGSPCGILTYEGSLLPEKYRGALIHADAGPREIRAFHKKPKGAGYELDKSLMLTSSDTWYRPSDVCVAPDGSVFVCDWYDPGVGGHGMGDTTRGRVYRITPKNHNKYVIAPSFDGSVDSLKQSLNAQNLSLLPLFRDNIRNMDLQQRETKLKEVVKGAHGEYACARAIWQLLSFTHSPDESVMPITNTLNVGLLQVRSLDVFSARNGDGITSSYSMEIQDKNNRQAIEKLHLHNCRDILLLFRKSEKLSSVCEAIYVLMNRYDGQDRTYLAALNIACGSDPARRDAILADFDKHFPEWNDKVADLVWELRPKVMLAKMDGHLKDAKLTAVQKARIVDILAGSDDASAGKTMLALLSADHPPEVKAKAIEHLKLHLPTKWKALAGGAELKTAIASLMKTPATRVTGLQLVAAVRAEEQFKEVIRLTDASGGSKEPIASDVQLEAIRTLGRLRKPEAIPVLVDIAFMEGAQQATPYALEAIHSLGHLVEAQAKDEISQKALAALEDVVTSTKPTAYISRKLVALEELTGNGAGAVWLIKLKEDGKFPAGLDAGAGILLRNSPFRNVQDKAKTLFPAVAKMDLSKLPSPAALARITGDKANGKKVYQASFKGDAQCMKCHKVNKEGGEIGPDLSAIGKKASRENLFESILQPSKAIADQFATWKVETDDGQSITGLLIKESPTEMLLRDANGKDYTLPVKGSTKKKATNSVMPDDIAKSLTEQELIDLVEYLFSLKE